MQTTSMIVIMYDPVLFLIGKLLVQQQYSNNIIDFYHYALIIGSKTVFFILFIVGNNLSSVFSSCMVYHLFILETALRKLAC